MQPMGRKKVRFPAKRDVHPRKGWVNWWESIADCISRHTLKQKWEKDKDE